LTSKASNNVDIGHVNGTEAMRMHAEEDRARGEESSEVIIRSADLPELISRERGLHGIR
jgi:hypothetical protein